MNCPYCNTEVPDGREICPNNDCYRPLKPLPIPPGGKIKFGGYDWYILEKQDNKMLVLTEKVIEKRVYNGNEFEFTWETCDMRKYLNEDFYNSFSEPDRARIIETINKNNDNPWYGTSGGNPTTDKIFLLSIEEVVKYFGDNGQLKTKHINLGCDWCKDEFFPWIDGQYNINRRAVDDSGMVVSWRLRSPGANGRLAAMVMGNCDDEFEHGGINVAGGGSDISPEGHFLFDTSDVLDVIKSTNGLRPALWLRSK